MRRVLVAAGVVVLLVVAGVALSTSSAPSRRVRVVGHGPTTVPLSPELTTTTIGPTTTTTTTAPPVAQPPTTSPQPPSPPTAPGSYTVQAGDTLAAVAAAHGLDWPGLCAANRLADCGRIYPGQVLELKSAPAPCCSAFPPSTEAPNQHTPSPVPAPAPVPQTATADGCAAGAAYVAANAIPGTSYQCGPGLSEPICTNFGYPNSVGCTVVTGAADGTFTAAVYIDSNCAEPTAWENEAANTWILSGRRPRPIDPYGAVTCPPGFHF